MKNYFIKRDKDGNIKSTYARPQYEGHEFLPEDDQEIVDHLQKQSEPTEAELNEQKIQAKIRQMAIDALKADNELPSDFEG